MRYPAAEKLEIMQLVERSHLPAKQTLDMLGIPRTTFYRWYARFRLEGQDALRDKAPLPGRIWNRIPDAVRDSLITLALDRPELSPRELAVTFTDSEGTDKLTRRPGLALLDRDLSALYVDASAHSERVLRSKDARRSHISEQK